MIKSSARLCRLLQPLANCPVVTRSGELKNRFLTKSVVTTGCSYQSNEDMDDLKKNQFYDKYADKLKKAQEGDPSRFNAKLDELEQQRRRELEEKRKQEKDKLEEAKKKAAQRKIEGLSAVMKLDTLQERSPEEIREIWSLFHEDKNFIFAVIPGSEWDVIAKKAQEYPTFLYPLPRQEGYEFFVQQFDGNECHITPLLAYQTHKENAPACLTLTHYPDIVDSKGIVLMRGEPDPNILGIHEAQLLALQVKMYYTDQGGEKDKLVKLFSKSPDSFRHMDLVKEFEKFKQGAEEKAKEENIS